MNNPTGVYPFLTFDPWQASLLVHFLSFIQAIDPSCDIEGLKRYIRNPDYVQQQLELSRIRRSLPLSRAAHEQGETINQAYWQTEALGEVQGAAGAETNTSSITSRPPLSDMSNLYKVTAAHQPSSSFEELNTRPMKRRRRSFTPQDENLPVSLQEPDNSVSVLVTNPTPVRQPQVYYQDEGFFSNENHVQTGTLPSNSPQLDGVQLTNPYPSQLDVAQFTNSYPLTPTIYSGPTPSGSGVKNTLVASPTSDLSHSIPSWRPPQDLQVYCQWRDCDQSQTPHASIMSLRQHLKAAHGVSSSKGNRDKKRMDCKWDDCQAHSSLCSIMNHVMTHVPEAKDRCSNCHKQVLCRDKPKHQKECWP